jgi:thiol-disulfide isomerase/thioredoxin
MTGSVKLHCSKWLCWLAPLAIAAAISPAWGRAKSPRAPDALAILERAARQYSHLETYRIMRRETFSNPGGPGMPPRTIVAIRAPGGRYRFEGNIGLGPDIQVSNGKVIWYYRSLQNAYTQRDTTGAIPELPEVLSGDEAVIKDAANLVDDMTWFAGHFKSARQLPDADLTLNGRTLDCYVIEVNDKDRVTPLPYPYTEKIWIQKKSFKIRKIVEHLTATLVRPGSPPISYPETRTSVFPEVALNEPTPDGVFSFKPPATAHLVAKFSDRPRLFHQAGREDQMAPDLVLTSEDGSRVPLQSFRGRPVVMDMWASWCGPCIEAFPDLKRLYDRTRSTDLVILSVDVDDNAKAAQQYHDKMHYPWPNFHDGGEVGQAFGVMQIPTLVIINAKGDVVFDTVNPPEPALAAAIAKLGTAYAAALAR